MIYAKKEELLNAFREALSVYEYEGSLRVMLLAFSDRFSGELKDYESSISLEKTAEEKRQMMFGFLFYNVLNSDSLPPFVMVENKSDAYFVGVWLEQLTRGIGVGGTSHHFLKLILSRAKENAANFDLWHENVNSLANRDAFETDCAVNSGNLSTEELKKKYDKFDKKK